MNAISSQLIKPPSTAKALADFGKGGSTDSGNAIEPVGAIQAGIAEGNTYLNLIRVIAFWFAKGVLLPVELCFRRQIGERYHTGPVVVAFFLCIWGLNFIHICNLTAVQAIIGATIVLFLSREGIRFRAQKKGVHWHSYSEGSSILAVESLQQRWTEYSGPFTTFNVATNILEPLALLAIFVGLRIVTPPFSGVYTWMGGFPGWVLAAPWANYFLVAAIVSAVYQTYCCRIRRGQMLDHLDAELMIDAHAESMDPSNPPGVQSYKGAAFLNTGAASARLTQKTADLLKTSPRPRPAVTEVRTAAVGLSNHEGHAAMNVTQIKAREDDWLHRFSPQRQAAYRTAIAGGASKIKALLAAFTAG